MDTSPYAEALRGIVAEDGRINFEELAKRRDLIDSLLQRATRLSAEAVKERPDEDRKLFWFSVYHWMLLGTILDHYPPADTAASPWPGEYPDSLTRVPGFWTERTKTIAGEKRTLQSIEADILWKEFPDPRWPFVLWRGSRSGPYLPVEMPGSGRLDAWMERRTQEFFRREGNFFRSVREKTLTLSPLILWYKKQILAAVPQELPHAPTRTLDNLGLPVDEDTQRLLKAVSPYLQRTDRNAIEDGGYKVLWSYFDWRLPDNSAEAVKRTPLFLETAPATESHAPEGSITMPIPADEQKRLMEMPPPKDVREHFDPDKRVPFNDPMGLPPPGKK